MNEAIETIETKTRILEIFQDTDCGSPREWDNLGIFVNCHPEYLIGDKNLRGYYVQKLSPTAIALPVYMYDHSGITINTVSYSCPWDSGAIGFIYVERETIRKEFSVKRISKKLKAKVLDILKGEIETLDQYLTGDVYYFTILKKGNWFTTDSNDTALMDSCGGFYGQDWENNGLIDHVGREFSHLLTEKG